MGKYMTLSCQCHSRYTHPFMAEYLTLSCQCRSRYTHPFMAEYLTLSCQCRSRYTHPFMAEYLTLSCQCRSRYTHPFMAEYLTLSCQCRTRYTHPFMAEYLTLSCRTSGEGCKKSSNACMHRNAPECTGRQKHSHICDKMTARCITLHKLVYRKILLNLRTLSPNRVPCHYVCHFKAIS